MQVQFEQSQSAAVFLDKNGIVINDAFDEVKSTRMQFAPGVAHALALLAQAPLKLIVVSNQNGVALGQFPHSALAEMEMQLEQMFAECGATLHAAYWCPHDPRGKVAPYACACDCSKPQPGMLLRAQRDHNLDLAQSWVIGDILSDVEAGNRAGCRSILADSGNDTEWQSSPARLPYAIVTNLYDAAQMIVERHSYEHPEVSLADEA